MPTYDFQVYGRLRRRSWNDLQNLGKDINLLTNHLLAHVDPPNPKGATGA